MGGTMECSAMTIMTLFQKDPDFMGGVMSMTNTVRSRYGFKMKLQSSIDNCGIISILLVVL
jgi:hypothetical protein